MLYNMKYHLNEKRQIINDREFVNSSIFERQMPIE